MLYKMQSVFDAWACEMQWRASSRSYLLRFEDRDHWVWRVNVPELVMADLTGRFMRERILGVN